RLSMCSNTSTGAQCGSCPNGYAGDGRTGCAPTLLELDVSHGTLAPELDPDVDTYDIELPVYIEKVTLTPTLPVGATATIRGAALVSGANWTSPSLNLELNSFDLTVEQEGQPSATYTLHITRGADATAYIKASNTGSGDSFGTNVALSADGRTLAVGASNEDSDASGVGGDEANDDALGSGAVYVFVRGASGWSQQAYLKASNAESSDGFGRSVALSHDGNTLAVGASGEDSNATGTSGSGQDNNDAS